MENWRIDLSRKMIDDVPILSPAYAVGDRIVPPTLWRAHKPGPVLVTLVSPTGERFRISGTKEIERAFRALESEDQALLDQVVASATPVGAEDYR